nr:NADH dehydrogenase subunit 6 [Seira dowlingi]
MKFISLIILLINSTMLTASHPVMILLLILLHTFMVCILTWSLIKSSWFSFILFIIFLGGLMVLFVYITSLASNEKFNMEIPSMQKIALLTMFFLMMIILIKPLSSLTVYHNLNFFKMISIMISNPDMFLILLVMTYLLVTLIVAVKISNKFEGPLRNMN